MLQYLVRAQSNIESRYREELIRLNLKVARVWSLYSSSLDTLEQNESLKHIPPASIYLSQADNLKVYKIFQHWQCGLLTLAACIIFTISKQILEY